MEAGFKIHTTPPIVVSILFGFIRKIHRPDPSSPAGVSSGGWRLHHPRSREGSAAETRLSPTIVTNAPLRDRSRLIIVIIIRRG